MKRTIALLCAVLLLTGCTGMLPADGGQATAETQLITEETVTATEEAELPQETTSVQDTSEAAEVTEEKDVPRFLGDHTYNYLKSFSPQFYEMNRELISDSILLYNAFSIEDSMHRISVENENFDVRNTSHALKMTGEELHEMVNSMEYSSFTQYVYDSRYDIYQYPVFIYVQPDYSNGIVQKSLQLAYEISGIEDITFNAFIKKTDDDKLNVIIDPAYLFEIPLLTSRTDRMKFDINGTSVYADTLSFDTTNYNDYDIPTDYVYAKISVNNLFVCYDTEEGYLNTSGRLLSYELISEDTDRMLMDAYLFDGEDKDPAMTEVYNTIMDDLDTVMQENTNGFTLLDLDFDGTPELLVSNIVIPRDENGAAPMDDANDVSVYRIENGKLKYIDTIYSTQRVVYQVANNLGLITLEDGKKGWFGTSYKNRETGDISETDYLYELVGDELIVTEVFSKREGDGSTYSDLKLFNNEKTDYYYFGEKMVFTEVVNEHYDPDEAYSTPYFLVWEDETSIFAAWEIYGHARAAFCENIEKSFRLYSPWLSGTDGTQPLKLTDREISYNIAYMVDSFYLGEYNAAEYSYYYWFLGGYAKPVIYLYPEQQTDVSVEVGFTSGGALTCTYPEYNGGWNVTALPDGTIYDENGDEYYCLYWEGIGAASYDTSKGWCVAGKDTASFLREKLMYIGLSAREANEFIIYWLPLMQDNKYNIISLHTEQYAAEVPLTVSPAPDTAIRVFMTFASSDEYVEIQPQVLPSYERNGFVLVEWGGAGE